MENPIFNRIEIHHLFWSNVKAVDDSNNENITPTHARADSACMALIYWDKMKLFFFCIEAGKISLVSVQRHNIRTPQIQICKEAVTGKWKGIRRSDKFCVCDS